MSELQKVAAVSAPLDHYGPHSDIILEVPAAFTHVDLELMAKSHEPHPALTLGILDQNILRCCYMEHTI